MLKAEVKKTENRIDCEVEASGRFTEIMADLTVLVEKLFDKLAPEIPFEKKVSAMAATLIFGRKIKNAGGQSNDGE